MASSLEAMLTPTPEQRALHERQKKAEEQHRLIASALAVGLVLAGLGVGAVQCLWWLHDGRWTPLTIWTAWSYAGLTLPLGNMEWIGVAKIIIWIMGQSLGVTLVIVGAGLLWLSESSSGR